MKLWTIVWLLHVSVVSSLTSSHLGSISLRRKANGPLSIEANVVHSETSIRKGSTTLQVNPLSQEDLPNLLGINPIEGTLIFGALYYFYGPTKLYEFAREAGKFVSTYGPVAKEVTTSVFDEFKEYLEEEGEREQLSNAGIDISQIERRTTNIFERFQASLDEFSQLTNSDDDVGELKGAYSQDVDDDLGEVKNNNKKTNKNRKGKFKKVKKGESNEIVRISKRELLEKREVDVDSVMDATEKVSSKLGGDEGFAESVNAVKKKLDHIKSGTMDSGVPINANEGNVPSAALLQQQMQFQAMQIQAQKAETEENQNRFQQQMDVSAWNRKVMSQNNRDKMNQNMDNDNYGDSDTSSNLDPILGTQNTVDEFGWPISEDVAPMDISVEATQLPLDEEWSNIPQELSASDTNNAALIENSLPSSNDDNLAMGVLKELDRDYSALRQRLLDLIEKQSDAMRTSSTVTEASETSSPLSVERPIDGERN